MPPVTELRIREIIREELGSFNRSDRYTFEKLIQILDGRNIQFATGTGTKIGTTTGQKLGFYNVTPVDQPATVSDPSGGITQDAESRTAIIAIIDRLQELGLIA